MQPLPCLRAIGIVAVAALAGAPGAQATVLDWDFSISLDNGDTASGEFVTQNTPDGGPYLIVSLAGTIDAASMSLLPPDDMFNDNLLYPNQPYFDNIGLGFEADGFEWAIWSAGGRLVDSWCNNSALGVDHLCLSPPDPSGAVTDMSLALVPEPGTLSLLGFSVLAALIGLQYRRAPQA